MTITQLLARFPDEESCRAHFFKLRWPDGKVSCPRCGETKKVYARKAVAYRWKCKACNKHGYRFGLTTATVFEDSKIPLRSFFQVLFLMLNAKKGKSALEIRRDVFKDGTSYETVWYACHRLRAAMEEPEFARLTGEVEVDETYIGGKEKDRHKSQRKGQGRFGFPHHVPVIGAIARKGNVTAQMIGRASAKILTDFVTETVSDEVSLVATDDWSGYRHLAKKTGLPHETVKHKQGEYVRGNVHTANLDSFWSLLKRGIMGSYHKVSADHLPLYLNEFCFRHNNRRRPTADVFDRVLESS